MARRKSDQAKLKEGFGRGVGPSYKPYLRTCEFNGRGTAEVVVDWKHGRGIQCLTQGEVMYYYILRWDDRNVDIREQYPLLDKNGTNAETMCLARELGVQYPGDSTHIMTTNFLVTEAGGSFHAYAVKTDRNFSKRERERLQIEALYWARRSIPFTILYKSEANHILATNIRLVTRYYDKQTVFDHYSEIKHQIATKQYASDLSAQIIDTAFLNRIYEEHCLKEEGK